MRSGLKAVMDAIASYNFNSLDEDDGISTDITEIQASMARAGLTMPVYKSQIEIILKMLEQDVINTVSKINTIKAN